jgi:hypothetical protein
VSDLGKSGTLFYIVDWLPPDFGAVGQYAMVFAREIAEMGRSVRVIGLSSGSESEICEKFPNGAILEVKKLASRPYNKASLFSRTIWSLLTNTRLIWEVIKDPRAKSGEILFTGSPPFMLFFAVIAKGIRRVRLNYRITDFYPEVIIVSFGKKNALLSLFQRVTWKFRKCVDEFQVLGEDQRRLLLAGGIQPERITLKRDVSPITISGSEKPAPVPAVLGGLKVLLYSGNFGVAHETNTVVEGFIRYHRTGRGHFGLWLNAVGSSVGSIAAPLHAAGVPIACSDPVSLEKLPGLLAAADAHLITLRSEFSGLVLPSKIYACLQSRRPILYVGPRSSDIHLLCCQTPDLLYEQVEPGDVAAFAAALERFDSISLEIQS